MLASERVGSAPVAVEIADVRTATAVPLAEEADHKMAEQAIELAEAASAAAAFAAAAVGIRAAFAGPQSPCSCSRTKWLSTSSIASPEMESSVSRLVLVTMYFAEQEAAGGTAELVGLAAAGSVPAPELPAHRQVGY